MKLESKISDFGKSRKLHRKRRKDSEETKIYEEELIERAEIRLDKDTYPQNLEFDKYK